MAGAAAEEEEEKEPGRLMAGEALPALVVQDQGDVHVRSGTRWPTAIEYGAPPAASVPPFVHNVAVRSKNAALHVRRCTADIRDKVASAASDYLSYLEDPSLPTVMDFDDLLAMLGSSSSTRSRGQGIPLISLRAVPR